MGAQCSSDTRNTSQGTQHRPCNLEVSTSGAPCEVLGSPTNPQGGAPSARDCIQDVLERRTACIVSAQGDADRLRRETRVKRASLDSIMLPWRRGRTSRISSGKDKREMEQGEVGLWRSSISSNLALSRDREMLSTMPLAGSAVQPPGSPSEAAGGSMGPDSPDLRLVSKVPRGRQRPRSCSLRHGPFNWPPMPVSPPRHSLGQEFTSMPPLVCSSSSLKGRVLCAQRDEVICCKNSDAGPKHNDAGCSPQECQVEGSPVRSCAGRAPEDLLPGSLWADILSRVPRHSWPAVRAVCRAWREQVGSPDMIRLRRACQRAEPWAFMVEWLFRSPSSLASSGRGSGAHSLSHTLGLLWAWVPGANDAEAAPGVDAVSRPPGAPGAAETGAGPTGESWDGGASGPGSGRWYRMGCLPPMAGISHTSHVTAFGPYAIFLGGSTFQKGTKRGSLPFEPGRCVWKYNLQTGRACRLPDLHEGRVGCASAVLGGKLIVAGGTGANDQPLCSVEQFDPKAKEWVRLPDMHVARRRCCGYELNGRLWVFSLSPISDAQPRSVEVFDPATGKWTLIEKMLPDNLGGRVSTRFAIVSNRLVLTNHVRPAAHDVLVYHEESNHWSLVGQLPAAGYQGYGMVGLGDGLCVEGGIEPVQEPQVLAAALAGQRFLCRTPYVNMFKPFAPEGLRWQPGVNSDAFVGIPRRCQQCIVSCL